VNQATCIPASTACWPRASRKKVLPVPAGPQTTRFSRRPVHSRVRSAAWLGGGIEDRAWSQASKVFAEPVPPADLSRRASRDSHGCMPGRLSRRRRALTRYNARCITGVVSLADQDAGASVRGGKSRDERAGAAQPEASTLNSRGAPSSQAAAGGGVQDLRASRVRRRSRWPYNGPRPRAR
jgi:hypothetical protein